MTKIELLSPAGSLEKLKTVLRYGADAVYLGAKAFNLRSGTRNFTQEELRQGVELAHLLGKKVYFTLNIVAHNRDIAAMDDLICFLSEIKVDAVIVSDLGVLDLVRLHSNLPIHISTQASVSNWRSVRMYGQLGAERVILARELSLDEISEIREKAPEVDLEVFVHGAMCMSYSGRCSISNYLASRDGNQGRCANPCRWKFAVMEEKRPGQYFPVREDESGSYLFNSRDLSTITFLDKIIATGVVALKIEGRGKGLLYGATTAKVYREAIDSYYSPEGFNPKSSAADELKTFTHRGYTSGFYFGELDKEGIGLDGGTWHPYQLVAVAVDAQSTSYCRLITKNRIYTGMEVEVVKPRGEPVHFTLGKIIDDDTQETIAVANPNHLVRVEFADLEPGDLLRSRQEC